MKNILIVEDDQVMAVALRDGFQYKGYAAVAVRDGASALQLAAEKSFDLMILDVMLPKLSGFDVCRQLRRDGCHLPIIMLTSRSQEIDKVMGLELGADDYLTKPFSFMELIARVEAVLRRGPQLQLTRDEPESYRGGALVINFKEMSVTQGDAVHELTARETKLLRYFVERRGQVLTRDQLLDAVWGYDSIPFTRTVDIHIAKLRRKIERDPDNPAHLITIRGAGYKFLG